MEKKYRVIADIFLFLSCFLLPWWAVLLGASAFYFAFRNFAEFLAFGMLLDFIYPAEGDAPLNGFIFSAVFAIIFLIFAQIKKRMRFEL